MRIRTATTALLAVGALALTGCSSGSDEKDATPTAPAVGTTTPAASTTTDGSTELVAAVRAYSGAYFKPAPADAYALLSARCQKSVTAAAYAAGLERAVRTYGHQAVTDVTVDTLSGDLARVTYTYSVPVLTQTGQPWTREGGQWRYDAC